MGPRPQCPLLCARRVSPADQHVEKQRTRGGYIDRIA